MDEVAPMNTLSTSFAIIRQSNQTMAYAWCYLVSSINPSIVEYFGFNDRCMTHHPPNHTSQHQHQQAHPKSSFSLKSLDFKHISSLNDMYYHYISSSQSSHQAGQQDGLGSSDVTSTTATSAVAAAATSILQQAATSSSIPILDEAGGRATSATVPTSADQTIQTLDARLLLLMMAIVAIISWVCALAAMLASQAIARMVVEGVQKWCRARRWGAWFLFIKMQGMAVGYAVKELVDAEGMDNAFWISVEELTDACGCAGVDGGVGGHDTGRSTSNRNRNSARGLTDEDDDDNDEDLDGINRHLTDHEVNYRTHSGAYRYQNDQVLFQREE